MASDIAQDVFTKIWEKGIYLHPDRDKNLGYKMASDNFISKIRCKKDRAKLYQVNYNREQ
jgi:hypothetical protein